MPAAVKALGPDWVAVASGAGNVTFQSNDHPSEWYIHTASSGAPAIGGNKADREKPVSLSLAAGEYLHLRGRGPALVIADTLVP